MGLTRIRAEQISDIDYKQAVRAIAVTDVTLDGGAPSQVDGVNLLANDRVLVTGQDPASENGLYRVATLGTGSNGTWTRASDGNATGEIEAGMIVMVTEGVLYKDTQWKLTTNNPIVIGTTALTFEQNSSFAFGNISANGTSILANAQSSTVTFTAGENITITGNNTSKVITISGEAAPPVAITNGTSNVTAINDGNVTVSIDGTSNTAVFAPASTTFAGNVLPSANITYNLGSATQRWNDIWLSNSTIYLGNAQISANATAIVLTNPAGGNTVISGQTPEVSATTVNATGNITGGNIVTGGQISAAGNITAGNLSATNISGTLSTASQLNITSVGTLNSLNVTGNVSTGNVSGTTGTFTNVAGTLTTAAQPNVTSVGILSSLVLGSNNTFTRMVESGGTIYYQAGNGVSGSGNAISFAKYLTTTSAFYVDIANQRIGVGGNISPNNTLSVNGTGYFSGNQTVIGNITAGNLSGTNIVGTLTTAAQTNITSVGTLGSLAVTGNVTTGNVSGTTGTFTNVSGTLTTAAQPNVTSVGTLSSLSVTGNVTGGNITTAGQVDLTSGNAEIGTVSTIAGWYYENSFSVSAQDTEPRGIFFKPDGTRMYVVGNAGDDILQYDLGTAWDVSTAVYGNNYVVSAQGTSPYDVHFKSDGTVMYVMDGSNDDIDQYTLSSAWDIGSASFANLQFSLSSQESAPTGFWFKPDGTKMYVTGSTGDDVNEYNLGTAWNVSTASFLQVSASLNAYESVPEGLAFNADGTKMWIVGATYNRITEFTLSTPWDVSTLAFSGYLPIAGSGPYFVLGASGLFVDTGNGVAYVSDYQNDRIFQYATDTPTGQLYGPQWTTQTDLNVGNNLSVNSNFWAGGTGRIVGGFTSATSLSSPNFATTTNTGTTSLITGTTSGTLNFATGMTSGILNIGGTAQTGNILLGRSTANNRILIGSGATGSGNTTIIDIATAGVSGSNANVTIGSSTSGAITNTLIYGTANIGNITSPGTVSATGNVTTGANLVLGSNIIDTGALEIITSANGNITLSPNGTGVIVANKDIRNGQANGVGNIGTTGGFFDTIFAKATSAQYADVAEKYIADRIYSPGTVMEIGGPAEVQATTAYASTRIAGVVSTAPALLMNSTEQDSNSVELALLGRVPCRVIGTIRRGDLLTSSDRPGVATALAAEDYNPGCVIGKALQGHVGAGEGTIEVLVGRL